MLWREKAKQQIRGPKQGAGIVQATQRASVHHFNSNSPRRIQSPARSGTTHLLVECGQSQRLASAGCSAAPASGIIESCSVADEEEAIQGMR